MYYNFNLVFHGYILHQFGYYYLYLALFAPCIFLILPARKKDTTVPWYDLLASASILGAGIYCFRYAWEISLAAWWSIPAGLIFTVLFLEGARRTGGPLYFAVTALLVVYPLFADKLPGVLWGAAYTPEKLLESLIFTKEGMMGIITKVVTQYLLGFLVFAGFLMTSGAGRFFMNFASALLGKYRGGPAKVSVVASGLFGSLSGSAHANIIATGSFTIPTMKRIGYPAHYAAAIEATASTGGMLMPPVMGAVAFIMAAMVGVEYRVIIIAAVIPAILYYFGLLMQVDAYAGRVGLKGLPREEIPSLIKTLKEGWPFLVVLLFLLWGLLYMRWEKLAPWYASGLMILLSFSHKETALTPRKMVDAFVLIGDLIVRTTAIIIPIGFIMCGLTITGATLSFTASIINIGADNMFVVLILGVIVCYLLGMAGMVSAAYIFLSVTLAPAVMQIADFNIIAIHLFIVYYAVLAVFTLPVADAAFLAATLAGAHPYKTGAMAMRLGIVIYFIPFFFVFNPALVLQGSAIEALWLFPLCLIGIGLIAGGVEGYLVKMGRVELWARPLLVISGLLIGFPEGVTTITGAILALFTLVIMWVRKNRIEETHITQIRSLITFHGKKLKGGDK